MYYKTKKEFNFLDTNKLITLPKGTLLERGFGGSYDYYPILENENYVKFSIGYLIISQNPEFFEEITGEDFKKEKTRIQFLKLARFLKEQGKTFEDIKNLIEEVYHNEKINYEALFESIYDCSNGFTTSITEGFSTYHFSCPCGNDGTSPCSNPSTCHKDLSVSYTIPVAGSFSIVDSQYKKGGDK